LQQRKIAYNRNLTFP